MGLGLTESGNYMAMTNNLVEAMNSAAATGTEVAGQLLHDASQAAGHAADATTRSARRLLRTTRKRFGHRSSPRDGRLLVVVGVLGAAFVVVKVLRRSKEGAGHPDVRTVGDDGVRGSDNRNNGAMKRKDVVEAN
jgi:hypothetical protein